MLKAPFRRGLFFKKGIFPFPWTFSSRIEDQAREPLIGERSAEVALAR